MKLYVWEEVLTDYTDGIVCVLARSEKQAWNKLYEKDNTAWWILQGEPRIKTGDKSFSISAYKNQPKCGYFRTSLRPRKVTESEAFVIWGGG